MRTPIACAAMMIALAGPALAVQAPARGDGLLLGAGVGSGWARVTCSICRSVRGTALAANLRLGGQLRPGLVIGAEANGWMKRENAVDERLWGVTAVAYWYPNPRGGLSWKGGVGLLSYRAEDDQDVFSTTAFAVQLGAGYEMRLGSRVYLAPYANVSATPFGGTLKFNGAEILDDANLVLLQLGVGLTRR